MKHYLTASLALLAGTSALGTVFADELTKRQETTKEQLEQELANGKLRRLYYRTDATPDALMFDTVASNVGAAGADNAMDTLGAILKGLKPEDKELISTLMVEGHDAFMRSKEQSQLDVVCLGTQTRAFDGPSVARLMNDGEDARDAAVETAYQKFIELLPPDTQTRFVTALRAQKRNLISGQTDWTKDSLQNNQEGLVEFVTRLCVRNTE